MQKYHTEKLQRAKMVKEQLEDKERILKIIKAKRWETFKEN